MQRIIFLNSHPIQYFAPLYFQTAKDPAIFLQVFYCSNETLKGCSDVQFGVTVKWDIPLLEGYDYKFIKNASFKPSISNGFWGLLNWDIISILRKLPKSIVIVHGWSYATNIITIIAAKIFGHTVCLRGETPLNQELQKNKCITLLKHLYLRCIFLFTDYALYIGKQNKLFYQYLGFEDSKLFFTPYCVDNVRFSAYDLSSTKSLVREKLGLPADKKIILFSGKYIDKKRPTDLLSAIHQLNRSDIYTVFVGDGNLRTQMESFIINNGIEQNVLLAGFINQSMIPYYYAAADVFVMCSGLGETWGLSVNEAMNFNIPIIISETCGSSFDLVKNGINGFTFKEGDIDELSDKISKSLTFNSDDINNLKECNKSILKEYSYETIITNLKKIPI
jgi:glycosyltransferase involved in cell wall biosynthesis